MEERRYWEQVRVYIGRSTSSESPRNKDIRALCVVEHKADGWVCDKSIVRAKVTQKTCIHDAVYARSLY